MDVEVPEPRDQILASGINNCPSGYRFISGTYRNDFVAVENNLMSVVLYLQFPRP
jgi:hypothetical protein